MRKTLFLISLLFLSYSTVAISQSHYKDIVQTGKPYTIVIQEAAIQGTSIESGDEVGIFDGERNGKCCQQSKQRSLYLHHSGRIFHKIEEAHAYVK